MDPYEETFRTWNKIAAAYQEKFMDLDLYNASYDFFWDLLTKQNAAVLDVGCGPGNITRYLLARKGDLRMTGIDIAPNMISLAGRNNPAAHFEVMDCRGLDTLKGRFDGIVCGFCLPYLSVTDSEKLIRDSAALLTDDGVFYASFIDGDPAGSGFQEGSTGDRCFIHYHAAGTLKSLLAHYGLELLREFHINYELSPPHAQAHTILLARKAAAK